MVWKERLRLEVARWCRAVVRGLNARQGGVLSGRPELNPGASRVTPRREVLTLAWPIAVALLGDTAMGLVDTRLVSGLGASSIGGVGLATTLMYLNYAAVFGLMRGVKVRAAHSLGEGRPSDALRYAQAGALLGFAAGVLVFFVARDISWALRALGVSPGLVAPAREFLAARTVLAPATCVLSAMIQWRQGVGDSKTPMRITLAGNIVNAGLAWALIHGRFGLPRLGVAGAGYATATAEALEASALLFVFARAWRESRAAREATGALGLGEALRAVLTVGGPTGLQFGVETLAFASFTTILGSLGEAGLAAHQIALATIRTSFLPGVAVGEAASVLVGRSLGRRALREADAVTRASLQTAVAFMALCGVVFALGGEALARAFTDDPAIVENVVRLLRVAAVFQVLDGVNIVLRGALRGAKDVRLPALLGITVVWVCVPGAAWFLGRQMGLGVLGGWLGFVGETTLCATVFYLRWRYGAWREAYRRPTKATGAVGALASVH